jgi:dTDP-4-dehydrorhamnose 3,5-epimerase
MMNGSEFESPKAKRFVDDRGWLQELGRGEFCQANWSHSRAGVLRGLHYAPYSKLVTCLKGRIFDVAVDCRLDTPDLGRVHIADLTPGSTSQAYIPERFAHGFLALEDSEVVYLQSQEWHDNEITLNWADPKLEIGWPTNQLNRSLALHLPIVSKKDRAGLSWKDFIPLLIDLRAMKSVH